MSIRRGMWVAAAALVGALPWVLPATSQAQQRSGAEPMSVKLLPPSPETNQPLRFVLNQPGYVAAFIVSPGEGVRLIYPLVNEEKVQWAGFHTEPLYGLHFDDDAYDVVLGRSMYSAASFGAGYADGPRYLYIVASRFPLDVTRFVHRPAALQRTVGYASARSFDSDDAIEGLLNNVVSLGAEDSWDTDVYMLWAPEWMDHAPHSFDEAQYWNLGTRVVACRNGTSQIVPRNWVFGGCYGESRLLLSRPAVRAVQRLASEAGPPTVLPTIRGVRMKSAPSRTAEPVTRGFLTTAAGGVTSTDVRLIDRSDEPQGEATYSTVEGESVIVIDRGEALRRREDDRRDEWRRAHREHSLDDDTPRLAPAPRLAPNPGLSPAPRLTPPPNVGYSRMNTPPVPRAEPRMEPPHMNAPAVSTPRPAPSAAPPAAQSRTSKAQ